MSISPRYETSDKKIMLFFCAPSFALLDNWASVIDPLRDMTKESHAFYFVIPSPETCCLIDLESVLVKLSQDVFDLIIYKQWDGNWYYSESFYLVKKSVEMSRPKRLFLKLRRKLNRNSCKNSKWKNLALKKMDIYLFDMKKKFSWGSVKRDIRVVLFDIYESRKDWFKSLELKESNCRFYSISHGIHISKEDKSQPEGPLEEDDFWKSIKAFIFSDSECKKYTIKYGLNERNFIVSGIPRHDVEWINKIRDRDIWLPREFQGSAVFLVSNTAGHRHKPAYLKLNYLSAIKEVVNEELGKKLIIKLHPKEQPDGLYEKVLGQSNYGISWVYTNAHTFTVSANCEFAITMHSGVAIDLAFLKVPVIEMLDLRGLSDKLSASYGINDRGEAESEYYRNGFVLRAQDENDLRSACVEASTDREAVVARAFHSYQHHFPRYEGVSSKIATIIRDDEGDFPQC